MVEAVAEGGAAVDVDGSAGGVGDGEDEFGAGIGWGAAHYPDFSKGIGGQGALRWSVQVRVRGEGARWGG